MALLSVEALPNMDYSVAVVKCLCLVCRPKFELKFEVFPSAKTNITSKLFTCNIAKLSLQFILFF